MYAPRHLVFAAAPAGEDEALPRLVLTAGSAAEAEKESDRLSQGGVSVVVAGPEQPRVEEAWAVVTEVRRSTEVWEARTPHGPWEPLPMGALQSATMLEVRGHSGRRALLLGWGEERRPLLVRTDTCEGETRDLLPDLIDACARDGVRLRRRSLVPAEYLGSLEGDDALPLSLALIDRLDRAPASWPTPLATRPRARTWSLDRERRPFATILAWAWWGSALLCMPAVLALLGAAGWSYSLRSLAPLSMAIVLAAWGSQRLYWSRWFDRVPGHVGPSTPAWPLPASEPGRAPVKAGLLLEALVGAGALLGRGLDEPLGAVARGLTWALPVLGLLALIGTFEASVARERGAK